MSTATLEPKPETLNAKPGVKRISFGKAAKKEVETKTQYPVFNDPASGDQVTAIAQRIKERSAEKEALEGALKTDKAELKMFVAPFYFKENANKSKPPSSISIPTSAGEVLVTFQNRYSELEDEGPLAAIIGQENVARFVRQSFELKIKGEELPVGKEQTIVDALMELLEKHGASAALEVKESLKPTPEFHIERLRLFTPEQNQQIDQLWPIITMTKTKGRGE